MRDLIRRRATATLPASWLSRLNFAASPEEIVRIAVDYLATGWNETQLARLPDGCRPPPLDAPQDVSAYAFTLMRAQLEQPGPAAAELLLDRMAVFFNYASMRVAYLAHIDRLLR
ncbi:MAG: hypothetical protein ACM3X5_06700 [Bacillota bacterium]